MEEDNYFINSSGFAMEMQINSASDQPPQNHNCFFNPTWETSVDHNDPFESALSSIVSSPVARNAGTGGEGVMLKELIGRLGSICNSGEISPESYMGGTNTSCYSTPLNSPPKLNLSMMDQHMRGNFAGTQLPSHPTLAPFSADPGFAERAARYSCFTGSSNLPAMSNQPFKVAGSRIAKQHSPENAELGDSREGSSVSEQIPAGNGRKRKSIAKGKSAAKETKVASENEESKAKKSKLEAKEEEDVATKSSKNGDRKGSKDGDSKPPEPPKDYIHVRARRGQATDSHSLAERVRREKISERMKFLQDLVPGCNKVTGKAVMLDEIINYVQSLQRQVEFLSMKLSTVNPRMDINMEALLSKEILQSRGSLPQGMYQLDSSEPPFPYGYHPQQVSCMSDGAGMPLPSMDGFGEGTAPTQVSGFWGDDLQSLVQMGFGPNQPQNIHGSMAAGQMKVEQ